MELASYCENLSKATAEAGKWVERNTDLVRNEREGLLKDLRRAGRVFRGCARAAKRKMSSGVFGPSQAGKSYLISALARRPDGNELLAGFGAETHDFLREINPEGGTESTGLVTRFTLADPVEAPAAYPVHVRLLTEMDLVKIIANAYYADCKHKEQPQSDIAATLAELKARQGTGSPRIDLDALEELREYIKNEFGAEARVRDELERNYWEEAIQLGQHLDLEGRIRLYALIWDNVEEFTALLRKLLGALERLGHPESLHCAMDSLLPRENSIINVETLAGLENVDNEGEIGVCTPEGLKTTLPRAVATALVAELIIVMRDKPAEYFEHTDLLDFPGYRSRHMLEDVRKELKKPGILKELYLRGKVAYLFQRYCAERELNSMLLCIGPSNQEVQDLPGVINDWVCATHGARPEDRVGKTVSLFFILTKFDMEFEEKEGAPDPRGRWDTRLDASLLNFFGKQHDWPTQWTPTRGFDNLYLLRNPNIRFKSVMQYDGDREVGVRADCLELVEKLHSAFMDSPKVAAHFRDPGVAWDEAMRLNDGGISHIRDSLSPLCDPGIKERQLLQNIDDCRNGLLSRLGGFYRSDDRAEIRKQKLQLIKTLFGRLGMLEKKQRRVGQLLRNFTVTDSFIYDLHPEAVRRYRDLAEKERKKLEEEPIETSLEDLGSADLDLAEINPFAEEASSGEAATSLAMPHEPRDEAAFFASYIESKWVEAIHQLADDPQLQKYFMLPAHEFSALASELATGAARYHLSDALSQAFRKAASYTDTHSDSIVRKQSAIAARVLNSFVDWLGFNPQNPGAGARTIKLAGGKDVEVFSPHPPVHGMPELDENVRPYTTRWLEDWLNALAGLIMDNVDYDGEQTFNAVENAALGALLGKFDTAYGTSAKGINHGV